MAADLVRLARLVKDLSNRERQRDTLRTMVEQIDRSGLYVVAGELELLKALDQRLESARAALDALAQGDGADGSAQLAELERLLTGALWLHADGVIGELSTQREALDRNAAELGAWVAPWHERVLDLERRLLQVTAEGASEKALKDEKDGLVRLKQRLRNVDEALKDGRHSAAMSVRTLLEPLPGTTPALWTGTGTGTGTGTASAPVEPPVPDLAQLAASIDDKAAAGRTMTQLAEVLLLRGPATPGFREYTLVLRTPSAPGSHGVSIHDTFKVVEQDHKRAGKGADKATGAVRGARAARQAKRDFDVDTPDTGPPGNVDDKLRDVGDLLYRVFLPGFARRLLAESHCPVSITTNDVTLPWELLHDGKEFLSLARPLARMPTGQALPRGYRRRLTNRRLRFLLTYANPSNDLPHVKTEVESIQKSLIDVWGERIEVVVEPRPTGEFFNDALRRDEFDVIHYAGHAAFAADDEDEGGAGLLLFGDEEGSTEVFPASKILGFVEGSPIVFLNACNTGKSGEESAEEVSYAAKPATGLGSAFVYGGALACVGSLWPVYDEPAQFFAVEFYNAILDRDSIGAAMLAARVGTHKKYPDDPTWASFVLFGNPTFRLDTSIEAAALAARTLLSSA